MKDCIPFIQSHHILSKDGAYYIRQRVKFGTKVSQSAGVWPTLCCGHGKNQTGSSCDSRKYPSAYTVLVIVFRDLRKFLVSLYARKFLIQKIL
jgi:hypothetical protein